MAISLFIKHTLIQLMLTYKIYLQPHAILEIQVIILDVFYDLEHEDTYLHAVLMSSASVNFKVSGCNS